MQRKLDERIIKEKGLKGLDLLPNTVVALLVELAEATNEWQGFKHWKVNPQPKPKLLEEIVDVLHFVLSLALKMGMKSEELYTYDDSLEGDNNYILTELFYHGSKIGLMNAKGNQIRELKSFMFIFFNFIEQRLGFTWEQIEQAYMDKNKVNHERQVNGY